MVPFTAGLQVKRFGGLASAVPIAPKNPRGMKFRRPVTETRCVDLFVLVRLLLLEYREEQCHRWAACVHEGQP